ncbi:MAG: repeat containing protein [Bryobacterales bacterium]|nr:repeat containing protein [Bryobacterales bacterium]
MISLYTRFIALALFIAAIPGIAAAQSCPATVAVGYRVATYGSLKVGLWYPTSGKETSYPYFSNLSGSAAYMGPPLNCGRVPLVVFSHAFGGCGTQIPFFTEELARHGYVVAAPDHRDALCSVDGSGTQTLAQTQESFLDPASWTDATYADRKDDVELTIASVLKDAVLAPLIDSSKIALTGHSLGGYTVFGIAGGWASWKDPRIAATLLFSPYILPFQSKNTVAQVSVPVMYQGAQFDIGITPFLLGKNGAFAVSRPPKFLTELMGGTHFDWSVLVCGSQPTVAACLQNSQNAQVINAYGFAFLDHMLKSAPTPLLFSRGAGVADYERTTLLTPVIAASYSPGAAPEAIESAFGDGLADKQEAASGTSLPTSLSGISVTVTDSQFVTRPASLFFVSPGQINIMVPKGTAVGSAAINVLSGDQTISTGTASVAPVAPALFSADATGKGVAAAQSVRLNPDGSQRIDLVYDPATLSPVPINLGGGPVYLVLYGTGMRNHQSSPEVVIGGQTVPVAGLGAQSQFAGLDQLNVGPLPGTLAGRGNVQVSLTIDGQTSNRVNVVF